MTYHPPLGRLMPHDGSLRHEPLHPKVSLDDTGSAWSAILGLGAMAFIVSALIIFSPSSTERTSTASNIRQTRVEPAPTPSVMPDTATPTASPQ